MDQLFQGISKPKELVDIKNYFEDEAKAKETIDGILAKAEGDFGAAIGMLTSGLGE